MFILPKAIYRFNAIPIKIPISFFTKLEKSILKFIWYHKRPWLAKVILSKKKLEALFFCLISKYTTKGIVIKTVCYQHKNRYVHQWNRIESLEINLHIYNYVIFDKGAKNRQKGKDSLFNKWCWENWTTTCKNNETGTLSYITQKSTKND